MPQTEKKTMTKQLQTLFHIAVAVKHLGSFLFTNVMSANIAN